MTTSVPGVFRGGRVELTEQPNNVPEDTPVLVTFVTSTTDVDLRAHGIEEHTAAEIRTSLSRFTEEWDAPGMEAYDRYDEAAHGSA